MVRYGLPAGTGDARETIETIVLHSSGSERVASAHRGPDGDRAVLVLSRLKRLFHLRDGSLHSFGEFAGIFATGLGHVRASTATATDRFGSIADPLAGI